MKRPLLLVMVAFGLGELAAYGDMEMITAICFVVFLWCMINYLFDKGFVSFQRFILAFICTAIGFLLMKNRCMEYDDSEKVFLSGINNIEGIVTDIDNTSTGYALSLRTEDYKDVIIYVKEAGKIGIGNKIKVGVSYMEYEGARNEGGFNDRLYYRSVGISGRFYSENIIILNKRQFFIRQQMYELKVMAGKSLLKIYGKDKAALYSAMLLGEKYNIGNETKELYKGAGIYHLCCISGTHMAILGLGVYKLFRRRFKFALSGAGALFIVISYGIFTGMGISVLRAVIMIGIRIGADMAGRTYDMVSSLSAAAVLIMACNPFALLNSGFSMSFGAVASICTIVPAVEKIYSVKNILLKNLLFSAGISIGTLPVIAYCYSEISTYGVIVNLIAVPVIGYILFSGIVGAALSAFNYTLAMFFAGLGNYGLDFYNGLGRYALNLPIPQYVTGKPEIWRIALYYSILMAALLLAVKLSDFEREFWEQNWYIRYGKLMFGGMAFVLMMLLLFFKADSGICIKYIDVGQGDSTFIRLSDNAEFLIDAGSSDVKDVGRYRIIPVLKANGVNMLDYLIVTHTDSDHINGIEALLSEKSGRNSYVKTLVLPDIKNKDDAYFNLERLAKQNNVRIEYISYGKGWKAGGCELTCLYPDSNARGMDKNELSAVMKLSAKGFSCMFMGDLGMDGEKTLIEAGRLDGCSILKAGHHGSKNSGSEGFLNIVKPKVSIISCGKNNRYGHPDKQTIKHFGEIGSRVYRTDCHGEIMVKLDKDSIKVESYIK